MLSAIEKVKRILEVSMNKVNEILEGEIKSIRTKDAPEAEISEEGSDAEIDTEAEEEATATAETAKESVPPEPKGTKPRPVARKGRNGELNKSGLIREYFEKNREARNQDVIEHVKEKHGIDLHPSLVSTVKLSMNLPKSKPGRIKGSSTAKKEATKVKAKARKTGKREGLPMVACVTRVVSKSKKGLHVDEVVDGIKKIYKYSGEHGEKGLKNVVYQALYALSQKKVRRGWEGKTSVVLHDDRSHTWKLNPKARKSA